MNLSSKRRARASEKAQSWTPPEFGDEPPEEAPVRDQVLSIFRGAERTRPHSALRPGAEEGRVTAWSPQDMDHILSVSLPREWRFVETRPAADQGPQGDLWGAGFTPEAEEAAGLKLTRDRAAQILADARAAADEILKQAREQIETQKKEAHEQGLQEAQAEMKDALAAAQAMTREVGEWQASLMAQGEQVIVDMLKDVAHAMFGEGVQLDANALQMNLNRVMESAQGLGDLNIFINPRDARLLDPSWSEYQLLITGNKVRVIPSVGVTPGGCMVKGATGTVDARVETQLAAVTAKFDEMKAPVK